MVNHIFDDNEEHQYTTIPGGDVACIRIRSKFNKSSSKPHSAGIPIGYSIKLCGYLEINNSIKTFNVIDDSIQEKVDLAN